MSVTQDHPQVPLVIVTYRDVYAWAAKLDKNEEAMYEKYAAIVRLSEGELKALGVGNGGKVRLSNSAGSVVVRAQLDSKCPRGFGFMPMSHIPNELTSYEAGKLPNFKWIEVMAQAITDDHGGQGAVGSAKEG
ncbi:MAG: molybdopterin dinucleotide binding domain-containing protein [Chloroflexota bacterium]